MLISKEGKRMLKGLTEHFYNLIIMLRFYRKMKLIDKKTVLTEKEIGYCINDIKEVTDLC